MSKNKIIRASAALLAAAVTLTVTQITVLADVTWTTEEWNVSEQQFKNVESFRLGLEDARSSFFSFSTEEDALDSQQNGKDRDLSKAFYQSLDTKAGQEWKFYYVPKPADRDKRPDNAHIMNSDYNDSSWDEITVPKSWEASYNEDKTFKYDPPHYTNVAYPWSSQNPNPSKPNAPTQFNPVGFYRTKLNVNPALQGKNIFLNFEGVESAFYIWINGHKVGFSEDSFTSKEFKIDEYLKYDGTDTIAVEVFKWSSGSWLEDQDMLRLAGIFRSVYLTAKDDVEIRDFTIVPQKVSTGIDPKTDYNDFNLSVYTSIRDLGATTEKKNGLKVQVSLYDNDGNKVNDTSMTNIDFVKQINATDFTTTDSKGRPCKTVALSAKVINPKKWSAEHPNLYKAVITLFDKDENIIETTAYRFGFRVVEIKNKNTANAQVIVNGAKLIIKGVNIHEMNSTTGRYVPSDLIRKDVTLMKQNNFNSVRMSHYSHDFRYYDAADEVGLYVMDETNLETHADRSIPGSNPNYLPACISRVSNMYYRSKNFPCVVMYSLGNEAGSGDNFGKMAQWLKGTYDGTPSFYQDSLLKGDVQNRPTHYEGDNDKADVKSNMYPSPSSIKGNANENKPYVVCEFSHAMGNSNGLFEDYWNAFESRDNIQGGYIWDWVDQTIVTYLEAGYAPSQINPGEAVTPIVSQDGNKIKTKLTEGATALNNVGVSGANDDHALSGVAYTEPTPDVLNFNGSFTLEAWVKPTTNDTTPRVIMAKGDSQYQLKSVNGKIQLNTVKDGWNTLEASYNSSTWANNWHHIAATYNTADKRASIYIDNMSTPAATGIFTKADVDGTFTKSNSDFAIGRDVQNSGSRDWNGLIDNARVYDHALNPQDLASNSRKASDDGVILWQDFNTLPGADNGAKPIVEEGYYGYGGDWGDNPNDGNFCQNGMVSADRKTRGSMLEVKRVQQDYVMNLAGLTNESADINIRSRAMFNNSSEYDFVWQLKSEGKVLREGTLDTNIAPFETKDVKITFDKLQMQDNKEYYLTAKFLLKSDTQWAQKGHEISASQMKLENKTIATTPEDLTKLPDLNYTQNDTTVNITGNNFSIVFDKASGTMSSFKFKGTEFLATDGVNGPTPNFWRAPVDNDRLDKTFQNSAPAWRNAGSKRKNVVMTVEKTASNMISIKVSGDCAVTKGSATYSMAYNILGDGQVIVDNKMTPSGFSAKDVIPAVGNMLQLSKDFENMTWYGRGSDDPELKSESYADRKNQQFIDVYSDTVSNQLSLFPKVQNTGNKADTRWVAFTNTNGVGLVASSTSDLLNINAQHYTQEELTTLQSKHYYEAEKTENVVVNLDYKQSPVGCNPGWIDTGWNNPSDIIRPTSNFSYSYKLSPVDSFTSDKANTLYSQNLTTDPVSSIKVDGANLKGFNTDKSDYIYYVDANDSVMPVVSVDTLNDKVELEIDQAKSYIENNRAVISAKVYGVEKTYTVTFKRKYSSVYLDDIKYSSGNTGAGSIRIGKSMDNNPMTLWVDGKDRVFTKGIGTHADSTITYNVKGKGYDTFSAYINLDREVYKSDVDCPGIIFSVYADNVLKYESQLFDKQGFGVPIESPYITVDISNAQNVKLVVTSPGGGINNAHADWADAKFTSYASLNREKLFDKIEKAEQLKQTDYPKSNWSEFTASVADIKTQSQNTTTTEDAILVLLDRIDSVVYKFKNPVIPPQLVKVSKVSIVAKKKTINLGEKVNLKASVLPTNASNKAVTWKSEDAKIATVSSSGIVKGIKAGKVKIYATAKDGSKKYSYVTLTVKPKKVSSVSVKKFDKNKVKIKFKKPSDISGVQIMMKQGEKGFVSIKKSNISLYIRKNLKKGNYQFKLRTYKKIKSNYIYGDYTKTYKITIK